MRNFLFLPFLLLYGSSLFGQFNIRFIVQRQGMVNNTIYVAGNFNYWVPGEENLKLTPLDAQHLYVDVNLPAGHYEYKFTRGDWTTVETAETGLDILNRVLDLRSDTTINIVIKGWLDEYKDISRLPDSTQWQVAYNRSFFYLDKDLDSSYKYAQQANTLLGKLGDQKYEAAMARILGRIMQRQGNSQKALAYYLKQLSLVQQLKDSTSIAFCLLDIGNLFLGIKDYQSAKSYFLKVTPFDILKTESFGRSAPNLAFVGIGKVYYNTHQPDSARFYALKAYEFSLRVIDRQGQSEALTLLGNILENEKRTGEAIKYYLLAIGQAKILNSSSIIAENYQNIARAFYTINQVDSSLLYARKALVLASELKDPDVIVESGKILVTLFKNTGQTDSAFQYLGTVIAAKDSVFNQTKNQQLQTILFNEELQKQEIKAESERFKTQVKIYFMTGGIILLVLLSILLWWNNRRKQQVNILLNEHEEKMQKAVAQLTATRSQLIQKEKMASMVELAAGIAHEIQNPLNFINNFSEVSMDIVKELKQELASINVDASQQFNLNSIADDLIQNQEKIMEHGKRADTIVKDMLQQSRDTGEDSLLL
jgi:tetratricopeptide (TPR) repeat protein